MINNTELVDLDIKASEKISIDICNRFIPIRTLLEFLKTTYVLRNGNTKIQTFVKREIIKSEESIEYLTSLLQQGTKQ